MKILQRSGQAVSFSCFLTGGRAAAVWPFLGLPRDFRCANTAQTEEPALLAKAVGAPVLTGYGLTETGIVTSTTDGLKLGLVGRSMGLELAIADSLGNLLGPDTGG